MLLESEVGLCIFWILLNPKSENHNLKKNVSALILVFGWDPNVMLTVLDVISSRDTVSIFLIG